MHFHMDVIQMGFNELNPIVRGLNGTDGQMSIKMRKFFNILKFSSAIYEKTTFRKCAPNPNLTENSVSHQIYKYFAIICVLNYIEMYSLRFRRLICGYFYRIRAKKRILFLYNKTLKKRKGFIRYSAEKVRDLVNEKLFHYSDDKIKNAFIYGLINENNCGFLVKIIRNIILYFAKKKCIVCDEKLKEEKFDKCMKCYINYCHQCWRECGRRCLVCKP